MRQLTRLMTSVAALSMATAPAAMFAISTGIAAAAPPGSNAETIVPLSNILRRCDFSTSAAVPVTGGGTGFALIRTESNKVVAEVRLTAADPNTHFNVRLIQAPRPASLSCVAGDPGTAVTALVTDAERMATVTVTADRRPGVTGAWVFIDRPQPRSQVPAEFYTSDFLAAI